MSTRSFYDLLELSATASADEIKRAFRAQIARYHPDKVQHLGQEFQVIAAERAAELTEAYRVLSRPELRSAYDRTVGVGPGTSSPASESTPPASFDRGAEASTIGEARATRDRFVRYAALARVRDALAVAAADYEEAAVKGFDLARVPRSRLFGRDKRARLLAKFVTHVDKQSLSDAWTQARRWAPEEQVCVLLVGGSMGAAGELAETITEQRRRSAAKVTVVPVDARDWAAHVPADTPPLARDILQRLRAG